MNLTGTEIKTLQAIYCRYTHLLENEINSQTCRYIYKNMNKGGNTFQNSNTMKCNCSRSHKILWRLKKQYFTESNFV